MNDFIHPLQAFMDNVEALDIYDTDELIAFVKYTTHYQQRIDEQLIAPMLLHLHPQIREENTRLINPEQRANFRVAMIQEYLSKKDGEKKSDYNKRKKIIRATSDKLEAINLRLNAKLNELKMIDGIERHGLECLMLSEFEADFEYVANDKQKILSQESDAMLLHMDSTKSKIANTIFALNDVNPEDTDDVIRFAKHALAEKEEFHQLYMQDFINYLRIVRDNKSPKASDDPIDFGHNEIMELRMALLIDYAQNENYSHLEAWDQYAEKLDKMDDLFRKILKGQTEVDKQSVDQGMHRAMIDLIQPFDNIVQQKKSLEEMFKLELSFIKLDNPSEIMSLCREIHALTDQILSESDDSPQKENMKALSSSFNRAKGIQSDAAFCNLIKENLKFILLHQPEIRHLVEMKNQVQDKLESQSSIKRKRTVTTPGASPPLEKKIQRKKTNRTKASKKINK